MTSREDIETDDQLDSKAKKQALKKELALRKSLSNEKAMKEIISSVYRTGLNSLSKGAIKQLLIHLQKKDNAILETSKKLQKELHNTIERGESERIKNLHNELDLQIKEWKDVQVELEDAEAAYQQVFLKERLIKRLDERLFHLKEFFILSLIIFVIILLVFDLIGWVEPKYIVPLFLVDTFCCLIFLANFFYELSLSQSKIWYIKNHWIDFITSIPLPPGELGIIRGGRSLRLLRLLQFGRLLRVLRIIFTFWRGMEQLTRILDLRLMKRSLYLSLAGILSGAMVINWIEGHRDPAINSLPESIWWSFTTMVTGGFGDIYNPNTTGGRTLTVILIIAGMVLIGVFTATLTSILVRDDSDSTREELGDLLDMVTELKNNQDHVMKQLNIEPAPNSDETD
ncbi:MAG: hypothetical protein CMK59_11190 [Proteobacteria bacterium]|nr:hypothetical protein [Pseudomonadota bacterium]